MEVPRCTDKVCKEEVIKRQRRVGANHNMEGKDKIKSPLVYGEAYDRYAFRHRFYNSKSKTWTPCDILRCFKFYRARIHTLAGYTFRA